MTTLTKMFDELETPAFGASVNVASGVRLAMKAAMSHPLVQRLREALPPKGRGEVVLGRLTEVVGRAVDPRFENPYDVALMTYLLLIQSIDSALARIASADVLQVPNTWWAGQVARSMAGTERFRSDAGTAPVFTAYLMANTAASGGTALIGASTILLHGARVVFAGAARGSSGSTAATSEVRILAAKPRIRVVSSARGTGVLAA